MSLFIQKTNKQKQTNNTGVPEQYQTKQTETNRRESYNSQIDRFIESSTVENKDFPSAVSSHDIPKLWISFHMFNIFFDCLK